MFHKKTKKKTHFRGSREIIGSEDEIRQCVTCKKMFPISNFRIGQADNFGRYRLKTNCSKCASKDRTITRRLEKIFGDTKPDHCQICEKKKQLFIDHDHADGSFRGWLCRECNTSLGKFNDNIKLLEKAIEYLKRKRYSLIERKNYDKEQNSKRTLAGQKVHEQSV